MHTKMTAEMIIPLRLAGAQTFLMFQKERGNKGKLTLDVTCALVNIQYPQDISLLNEAREKLETIIYRFCGLMNDLCRGGTGGAPEKITLLLPKAGDAVRRKYGRRSADSSVMLRGIFGIWMDSWAMDMP